MKRYLTGFGIIMAIGFTFALLGSNGASNMLAAVGSFDTIIPATTILPDATSTAVASTATTTAIAPATSTTTSPITSISPAPVTFHEATLTGLAANQIIQGTYALNVMVNAQPVSANFVLTNIQTNKSDVIVANCAVEPGVQWVDGRCAKQIDTLSIVNGRYSIVAHVQYLDGVLVTSNEALVYVYNTTVNPTLKFLYLPAQVSGKFLISGEITDATAVEFLYIPSGVTQPIRIGNGIFAGGVSIGKWTYNWDTTLVPNGGYTIIANVKNSYNNGVPYKAGETTVTIVNSETTVPPAVPMAPPTPIALTQNPNTITGVVSVSPTQDQTMGIEATSSFEDTTTATTSSEPTAQPNTVLERFLTQIKTNDQSNTTQTAPQPQVVSPAPVPVSPIIQRIQDIAIGLQGGGPESSEVARKLGALQQELWKGVNPASPAVQAKTQYQSAKEFGTTIDTSVLRVADVTLSTTTSDVIVPVATTTAAGKQIIVKETKKIVKEKLRLTGKGLPNTYVTIYIYSEVPTIAVIKTDRNGNWVYELNNKLADGKHEAYVTINDLTGKVVAKSARFSFVKTAEAVTAENVGLVNIAAGSEEPIQPVQSAKRTYALVVFMLIGAGLLVGIFLVARSFTNKNQDLS